ncbi:MAG: PA4642 family protein [Pseudomonadota bacterium]
MRKDKAKVLDEQWDDARVASFLEPRPGDGGDPDHRLLLRAYQSMRDSDFARFVPLFVAAGRDLNATGPDGKTVLEEVREHRYGLPYAEILEAAGAV